MDFEEELPPRQPSPRKHQKKPMLSPKRAAKQAAAQAAGEAFWLSFIAEAGPVGIKDICSQLKRRQQQTQYRQVCLKQWHEQEWEEDAEDVPPEGAASEPLQK